ncbi:MAG: chemotaxis response regulator protein-glutamate methylesterase [Bacteroidales bacterium]|jgi:two-component system chemotaxis response regulator CheB|nr:chemotaxis response regulator protein-glutamate methylesterase [Bacteroidales bacterium]
MKKIRVLIVDDSALVRQSIVDIINSDSALEVMATASDPFIAAKKMKIETPDVITLDIEMPKMNGLVFLSKIMNQHPIPVVIISSLTDKATSAGMKALDLGAIEVIKKPQLINKQFFNDSKIQICDAIKAANISKLKRKNIKYISEAVEPKYSADAILSLPAKPELGTKTEKIIVIGASTGGTEAIANILKKMPADSPGIVIVQHMPEKFTYSFAMRLNQICNLNVKEAEDGDVVHKGQVLIAPGNFHILIKNRAREYYIKVKSGPLVNRHRPSVDVLFRSAAKYAGKNAVGILLTGMGDDGARGLKELHDTGAKTIAQDEKSAVVFGMPKEAIKLNAADKILGLDEIPDNIIRLVKYNS